MLCSLSSPVSRYSITDGGYVACVCVCTYVCVCDGGGGGEGGEGGV